MVGRELCGGGVGVMCVAEARRGEGGGWFFPLLCLKGSISFYDSDSIPLRPAFFFVERKGQERRFSRDLSPPFFL